MAETAELRLSEAVPLAHALVARLAELEGVRILFIKGPTAVALGARPPRPSTDVDVLCEPGGLEKLGPALERCGWRRRIPADARTSFIHTAEFQFDHSVHFIHDGWPCDLDVHYNFPGFMGPDHAVFEALWQRRTAVPIAHMPVPCVGLEGQVAVVALHALRDDVSGRYLSDLQYVKQLVERWGSDERRRLAECAAATGASATLRPLFNAVGMPVPPDQWGDTEQLHRWTVRTQAAGIPLSAWTSELRAAPLSRKPQVLWRAMFLRREALAAMHVGEPLSWATVCRWQAERWLRAVRQMLAALRAGTARGQV